MTDAADRITPQQARKARDLLAKICALSEGIGVIDQSLRPLKILLEALSPPVQEEPTAFFGAPPQRSDIDRRWIAILTKEGLIAIDAEGRLRLLDEGARRIAAVL